MPLFPQLEELTYLDQDREHQKKPSNICLMALSLLAHQHASHPSCPMSHADNKSLGLLEYEMSSEG